MAKSKEEKGSKGTPKGIIGTPGTTGYSQKSGTRENGAKGGK